MYVEEMVIDDYLRRLSHHEEQINNNEEYEGEEPPMSDIVQKYWERGELFLNDDEELVSGDIIAPDVLS